MGKRFTGAAFAAIAYFSGGDVQAAADTASAARTATEFRQAVDNSVSAAEVSEEGQHLARELTVKDQVPENQPANETNDARQKSVGIEEAARPAQKDPEGDPDDPQKTLLHGREREEKEEREKEDEELDLGDREGVSSGNITAPAPPAGGESAVTGEQRDQGAAPADEERSWAAAGADQQRAEAAAGADQQRAEAAAGADQQRAEAAAGADQQRAEAAAGADQQRAEAAAGADQQRAEAAARADDQSHQQAAAEDEERFGRPAQESEPTDETWPEDDADVDDPDID